MKSFKRATAGVIALALSLGAFNFNVLAEDTAIYTFFNDSKSGCGYWSNTYLDADGRGSYISEIEDRDVYKEGKASYRIKLATPYYLNTETSNVEMLYSNLVGSPSSYTPDGESQYLTFWYQPLLKREKVEVGFACGSGIPYAMLRVNLMDYISIADNEYGNETIWKEARIPLSDFLDESKTTFYANKSGLEEFNWNRFAGFSIAASDENLGAQINFCRIDEIKIIDTGGGTEKPTNPPATERPTATPGVQTPKPTSAPTATPIPTPSPEATISPLPQDERPEARGEQEILFFDDDKNGWSVTYTDSQGRGSYLSEIIDKTVMKNGAASYRLKLLTPYEVNTDPSNIEMLFCNIVNNPTVYSPNEQAYLEFWYQPMLKRERIEVGFACGDKPYGTLRVNLLDYADFKSYGENAEWYLIRIPMQDFLDSNKTTFSRNGSSYSSFDWTRFAGFSIAGSDENLPDQINFCRIDDAAIVRYMRAPEGLSVADTTYESVKLTWRLENETADGFYIYRDGVLVGSTVETSFTDTGLLGNHDYTYMVQSYRGTAKSEPVEVSVHTDGYFLHNPSKTVNVENIIYTANGKEISDYMIKTGTVKFTASVTAETTVYAAAVLYSGGAMSDCIIKEINPVNGGVSEFEGEFSVKSESDYIDIFLLDSIESMIPVTSCYRIGNGAYKILKAVDLSAVISSAEVSYEPRTLTMSIKLNAGADGYAAVMIIPEDADAADSRTEDILWLGVIDTKEALIAISDTRLKEGYYTAIIGTKNKSITVNPFYCASEQTLQKLYAVLNNANSTSAEILEAVSNPILSLDLSDFNKLTASEKIKVCELFKTYYDGNEASLDETFEKAVGIVILTAPRADGYSNILKYRKYIELDEKFTAALDTGYSSSVIKKINELMADAAVVYRTDEDQIKNVISRIETICILAILSDPNITWSQFKTCVSDTFAAYNIADLSVISSAGVSESDVYKKLIGKSYKSFNAVNDAIKQAVQSVKGGGSNQNGGGSGGGGSGGGGGSQAPSIKQSSGFVPQTPSIPQQPDATEQPEPNKYFVDAADMKWAYDSICSLAERGIVSYADNFRPNDYTTRAEFVKMIVQSFGLYNSNAECGFDDVPIDSWEYPYIASAVSAGIINGIDESSFAPESPITRQDMACIVHRMLRSEERTDKIFTDDSEISDYARESISAMAALSIINGYDDGSFRPKQFATRAEVAVMLYRTLK